MILDYFDGINAHKYIYLREISEPEDNCLRIVIEESITSHIQESVALKGTEMSICSEIQITDKSCVYEILFDSYIGYSVIDESFALPDDTEIFVGCIFRIYEKSNYLDYIKKASFACDDHPGPYIHYGLNCLNHVIDIVSADEPEVNLLSKNNNSG